ncbi:Phage repressor protein C, contains Cro/C1-type HTH and peptisase s24 domains [Enterococcus faecalis]|uniref:XRE family transcriptional regulator n=1 Tax=Enterococcus faecalis TaxID=1351 RepID=UPI00088C2736|nr:XRE family transcriptional regulator [Enterococcus faecalis]SDN92050.1 Phage repressor protein C, contains Cro/C1-type HTH and peptisase s24 domains [Enterococcus faecalis]
MSVFSNKLTELMKKRDISDEELATLVNVNRTTVTRWRTGERSPKMEKLPEISAVFNVDPRIFVGEEPTTTTLTQITDTSAKLDESRQKIVLSTAERQLEEQLHEQETVNNKVVPFVGKSAANPAVLEYGDTDIEQQSFAHVPDNADCAIYIQGDSMEPLIKNGSIVFYKKQCDVENGEIAIVEIDGDGVTCKKLIKDYENERIILRSINKKYDDRVLKSEGIRIIGKVVV